MKSVLKTKATEIGKALQSLGERIRSGDDSDLFIWVIDGQLACAHRPLRHHPEFGGSGQDLPTTATKAVLLWAERICDTGIRSIISLMHPKELRHYDALDLGAPDLIEFYRKQGFQVWHIPWDDPAHRPLSERASFQDELAHVRVEALEAFDDLPKPVLLHCSAGIDRSAPVAAYILHERSRNREHEA